jgi:hypothetical protein
MADFREVLEVSKNSTCFLSFSFYKTKEDLAVVDEDELPNPPVEVEFAEDAIHRQRSWCGSISL